MNFLTNLWGRFRNVLFPKSVAEREFGISPAVSRTMEQNISLWYAMFSGNPPWQNCDVTAIGLPAAICREVARPTLAELTVNITGSARADYLQERFEQAEEGFRNALEVGLALGGVAFKPYIYNEQLLVDVTSAAAFQPTKFDPAGRCIGGIFRDKPASVDGKYYIRLESHELTGTTYTIKNKAYYSDTSGTVGAETTLAVVPEWADIQPEITIQNMDGPLFAYFKPPMANSVDENSMCGMSIYGDSATVQLIRQADEQWERLRWEYRSSERKVLMDGTSSTAEMFNKRMFELGPFSPSGEFFKFLEPQIRDEALYRGFQNTLRRIEFNTGLSYGDISDPQTVEKTATEIRNGKQRKYVLIDGIQSALGHTFDALIYAMDAYATLYNLAPAGEYEAAYNWGDSILDDAEKKEQERLNDRQDLAAGILNDWEYRAKWYGEDEETAKAALPKMQDMTDGNAETGVE